MRKTVVAALPVIWVVAVPLLSACTQNTRGDAADGCDVSTVEAPAGTLTFDVKNDGSQVTEFYLLGEDGLRIVGEVENIGPQLERQLVVNAPPGRYVTACKPGMQGE